MKDMRADEKLLRRILTNLLSNAIKYSPDGGTIGMDVRREGEQVVFEVSDEGIGIPLDAQTHLFEPFHRARNAEHIQGTGLGMAIVFESIRLHNGTIAFQSEEDQGSTFTVRLPYAAQPAPQPKDGG
jgi:signal transduction histidine kinase